MKRTCCSVAAVLLAVMAFLSPLLLLRSSPVTRQAFDRIAERMSRKQVEAVLGGPPGDYRTGPDPSLPELLISSGPCISEEWIGDEGTVRICFGGAGLVMGKDFVEARGDRPGILETLERRLGRLKTWLMRAMRQDKS
jgi:hypothetical protein